MESNRSITVSCGACQWFVPLDSHKGQAGECRADRPTVLVIPGPVLNQYGMSGKAELNVCFPTVPVTLWCGRFMPKKMNLDNGLDTSSTPV